MTIIVSLKKIVLKIVKKGLFYYFFIKKIKIYYKNYKKVINRNSNFSYFNIKKCYKKEQKYYVNKLDNMTNVKIKKNYEKILNNCHKKFIFME